MPSSGYAGSMKRGRFALLACLALALTGTPAGGLPTNASAAEVTAACSYPAGVKPGVWAALPSALSSIAQLDSDPCQLVGVSPPGPAGGPQLWRSSDAGAHWVVQPGAPALDSIVAERLTKRTGSGWLGPVLATGPTTVPAGSTVAPGALDQVYASQDAGRHFSPSLETVASGTVPFHGRLLGAATAITYVGGRPRPDVYVATAPAMSPPAPGLSAEPVGYRLLKSTDGGATFTALATGAGVAATVVDVNPSNPDEIWVNNAHASSAAAGGALVSRDGGTTWTSACCPTATVNDIAVMSTPDATTVYLATDQGLMVSEDDGANWRTLTSAATEQVRTAPDDPQLVLSVSGGRVLLWRSLAASPAPTSGLPADCAPTQLRRGAIVPATFLVSCGAGSTYRLLLDDYGPEGKPPSGLTQPGPAGLPGPPIDPLSSVLMKELATWRLPGSRPDSGAVAFDGQFLYYDDAFGRIARVKAADGAYAARLPVELTGGIRSLTVDLKRNQLLVTDQSSELSAYSLTSYRRIYRAVSPYKVVSFDASFDGLSWVPEWGDTLERASRPGAPDDSRTLCTGAANGTEPSTFVADGAGGGYVQAEDDTTLFRINRACARVGPYYLHRKFSESTAENDAMACDSQSFFPQAAIWIRDSMPGTVTAYGVPYGYCPVPTQLVITAAPTLSSGTSTSICAVLTSTSSDVVIADRAVSISVGGVILGNRLTDGAGQVCLPYRAPDVGPSGLTLELRAVFTGDPSFYGSTGLATLSVTNIRPPTVRFPVAGIVVGPLGYAPPPPNPMIDVPGQPAQAPGPAPNIAQAPQAQAQAQAQGGLQAAAVPQPQRQHQLALVMAAQQVEAQGAGEIAMSALDSPRRRRPAWPAPLLVVAGVISCGLAGALARSRRQISVLRPPHVTRSQRSRT